MGQGEEQKPLPHYALPNFSVVLPTYSNQESDVITQAFRIGSFVTLSDLPNTVKPGQVSRGRFQKILDNRTPLPEGGGAEYKPKKALFSEFEYMPSPFSIVDEVAKEERIQHEAATAAAGHAKAFVMADTAVTLRHEDAFGNIEHALNTGGYAEPYERADDQALRFKWLQDAQILGAPFRPAGRVKGQFGQSASEMPTRASLPHIVDQLREAVEADWGEYSFLVCSTDDEHIVVRFELATLDSEPGLVAYMNMFARSAPAINGNMLRKVVEDWNVTPGDGHLYFTFRPPWVTARITDSYFALHPEARVFQDPRLKRAAAAAASSPPPEEPTPVGASEFPPAPPVGDVVRPGLS